MGYECPQRQTTADFLTSLTNPAERVVRPGHENRVPKMQKNLRSIGEIHQIIYLWLMILINT